jgi:hypothetical protein
MMALAVSATWELYLRDEGESGVLVMAATPSRDAGLEGAAAYFSTEFDCEGSILHQLQDGALESPMNFWFKVDRNNVVEGWVGRVAAPLDLPPHRLAGTFSPRHDDNGTLIGGTLNIKWPYVRDGDHVALSIMRETFIHIGPPVNGVGQIKLRASKTMYLAGKLRFDTDSLPNLNGLRRAAFISARCAPRKLALEGTF